MAAGAASVWTIFCVIVRVELMVEIQATTDGRKKSPPAGLFGMNDNQRSGAHGVLHMGK